MEPYVYNGVVESVVDGDTLHVSIDLGFGVWQRGETASRPGKVLRLLGCNARELSEPGGAEARDNLAAVLPPGTHVTLRTVQVDKYGGRYDAAVELDDGRDLVSYLAVNQWVALWDGTGTRPVPPWPRTVAAPRRRRR